MNQKKIEIFHGHNNNIVMSDLYKLSVSNIRKSLQFQKKIGVEKFRVLILVDEVLDNKITNVISKFKPDIFLQLSKDDKIDIDIKSSIVLFIGFLNGWFKPLFFPRNSNGFGSIHNISFLYFSSYSNSNKPCPLPILNTIEFGGNIEIKSFNFFKQKDMPNADNATFKKGAFCEYLLKSLL